MAQHVRFPLVTPEQIESHSHAQSQPSSSSAIVQHLQNLRVATDMDQIFRARLHHNVSLIFNRITADSVRRVLIEVLNQRIENLTLEARRRRLEVATTQPSSLPVLLPAPAVALPVEPLTPAPPPSSILPAVPVSFPPYLMVDAPAGAPAGNVSYPSSRFPRTQGGLAMFIAEQLIPESDVERILAPATTPAIPIADETSSQDS